MQTLFAAAIIGPGVTTLMEFYWADDRDHAIEQAQDANPDYMIVVREVIPRIMREDNGDLRVG